jgi:hypothetical protein
MSVRHTGTKRIKRSVPHHVSSARIESSRGERERMTYGGIVTALDILVVGVVGWLIGRHAVLLLFLLALHLLVGPAQSARAGVHRDGDRLDDALHTMATRKRKRKTRGQSPQQVETPRWELRTSSYLPRASPPQPIFWSILKPMPPVILLSLKWRSCTCTVLWKDEREGEAMSIRSEVKRGGEENATSVEAAQGERAGGKA